MTLAINGVGRLKLWRMTLFVAAIYPVLAGIAAISFRDEYLDRQNPAWLGAGLASTQ
jgi:hypothetical protein